MLDVSSHQWGSLERWGATLFLIAGGLLVIHAITHGLEAFAGIEYPWHHEFPFGVASLRTNVVSQTTGLVLLTPALVMITNFGIATAGYGSLTGQFVVATGFALAHLAIGATLRTEELSLGRRESAPRTTT